MAAPGAQVLDRGRRASVSSGSRRARSPTGARRGQAGSARPSARPPGGTEDVSLAACSRRSRAPRRPRRPRRPSTSRRRRTASGRSRPPAGGVPRRCTLTPVGVTGRARVVGRGPVRVMPERAPRGCLPRAREPGRLVLSVARVRRSHQRRDGEASGPRVLERGEPGPDRVVERSLNVAGDDRVPFPRRGAHRRRS